MNIETIVFSLLATFTIWICTNYANLKAINKRKDLLINMYEFQIEEAWDKIEELERNKEEAE